MNDEHFYERWDPERHAELIGSWWTSRGFGVGPGQMDCYPPTGFLVDNIVCGFVHITNSAVAIIDQWVSDPLATKEARRAAIDELFVLLCDCAKEHGSRAIWLTTSIQNVIRQSKRHGFDVSPIPFQFAIRSL